MRFSGGKFAICYCNFEPCSSLAHHWIIIEGDSDKVVLLSKYAQPLLALSIFGIKTTLGLPTGKVVNCLVRLSILVKLTSRSYLRDKDKQFKPSFGDQVNLKANVCLTDKYLVKILRNPGRDISFPIFMKKEIETRKLDRKSKQKISRLIDLLYL